jgi:opacity protein-like surface antigen
MSDSQFDDFARGKLGDHEVPVPGNLWNKVSDGTFDHFFADKLKGSEAPVPPGLWEKITDTQFDHFAGDKLTGAEATVPDGMWGRIADGQFDDFVRNTFTGATAPVPAGLWEKIMPEEDDDKGGFIWFNQAWRIAAVFLLIAGLAAGSYYWYKASHKQNAIDTVAGGSGNGNKTDHETPAANDHGAPAGGKTGAAQSLLPGADKPNNDFATTDHSNAGNTGHAQENISPNTSAHTGNRLQQPNSHYPGNTSLQNTTIPGNTINHNITTAESLPLTFPEDYTYLPQSKGVTIPFSIKNNMAGPQDRKISIGNHAALFNSIIICPTDRKGNRDWYLEAYASPDIAFRSFSNNSAAQQYISRKDSSESMRPGFTAGIRLVKPVTDNILIRAGLQYSQANQKYVYRTENETKNITVVTTRTIIRSPGDTVVLRDTSTMLQIGYRNNTVINRFRTLDIPVTVGYQFGNDDLTIGLNAGVVVNLSSWYQGVMLDSTLATVPLTRSNSSMVYKNRIGLGLYGGISVVKRLSDDLHLFAEPYFRYNLSNMTVPNAAYNQKFSFGGISLGVRLNLNRQ